MRRFEIEDLSSRLGDRNRYLLLNRMKKDRALFVIVSLLMGIMQSGCKVRNSDAGKLSETFVHEQDGIEYLWLVIDAKDGQHLADAVYFHSLTAIDLAEKCKLKGFPLIETNRSHQGNIVFFVRQPSEPKKGFYQATTVENLKGIRALSFDEFEKNIQGNCSGVSGRLCPRVLDPLSR